MPTNLEHKSIFVLLISCFLAVINLPGQNHTQTIRGMVLDAVSQEPLIGAEIFVIQSDPLIGTSTDASGLFELSDVPVGRIGLQCQYVGYETVIRDNIQINSAREYQLEIQMKTGVDLTSVTVKAYNRNEAVNEAALVSIRRLDPEELQYHAATANDPGRLVMTMPGVQPSRDTDSDVIIRGNSTVGVLWRLEGVDIPNPNHFARRGSSGGGITIFSASMLGSSDFITGAFPAEYGNVFSGIFDMKFRNGNNQNTDQTVRAGLLGLDYAMEGPIKKGKSSYLTNFRYSTLGILNSLGLHLVGPRTDNNFQDLSFKIHSRGTKSQWSFWGIGGNSREIFREEEMPWEIFRDYSAYDFTTQMGVIGTGWNYLIDKKSFIQINAAIMGQEVEFQDDTLALNEEKFTTGKEFYKTNQYVLNGIYRRTFNPHLNFKAGVTWTSGGYDLFQEEWDFQSKVVETVLQASHRSDKTNSPYDLDRTLMQQYFTQFTYRPSTVWTFNLGAQFLTWKVRNQQNSIEPRISVKYQLADKASLLLAYTKQSRTLPLGSYFTLAENGDYPNLDLDLIRTEHWVLGFNQHLGEFYNLHTEFYLQKLRRIPISLTGGEIYWLLNDTDGFAKRPLTSVGRGENIGLEISVQRFYHKETFFMISTSIYNSTFRVPGIDRKFDTRYNAQFNLVFSGGKNFPINNNTVLETGFRLLFNSGQPITPIADGFEKLDGEEPVLDLKDPYSDRVKDYVRPDLRLALRKNKSNSSYWLALDIQNIINRENEDFIDYRFYSDTQSWRHRLQSGLIPLLTFQLDF